MKKITPRLFALAIILSLLLASYGSALTAADTPGGGHTVFLPVVTGGSGSYAAGNEWSTLAANPQRTSWSPEEVRGRLRPLWFNRLNSYISQKVQVIGAYNTLYISTADGLYALNADNGAQRWFFPTQLPLGHSPSVSNFTVYVGGLDKNLYAIDALNGREKWRFTATAGFETNPLVVAGRVYAGSRDGVFYALDAGTGALLWTYTTDGPILFSAAYQDGVVYFASNDNHAYALNASTGALVWKSDKLPGDGFHSYWPVVYKDYVIFAGSRSYRSYLMPYDGSFNEIERDDIYPAGDNSLLGPVGAEPGDWVAGTPTLNASRITQYLEDDPNSSDAHLGKPWRRTVFVLSRATGKEYTYDSDHDGKAEYAPFLWTGTHSGNRYPPVIGSDGVMYVFNNYRSNEWIPRGNISGWKFGTQYLSLPASRDKAVDEPHAYAAGGNVIYWNHCCNRGVGAFDISIANTSFPNQSASREWYYFDHNFSSEWPALDALEWPYAYGTHGDQNAPIPYKGKVFLHRSNAILAYAPAGTLAANAPLLAAPGSEVQAAPLDTPVSPALLDAPQVVAAAAGTQVWLGQTSWPQLARQTSYTGDFYNYGYSGPGYFSLVQVGAGGASAPTGLNVTENDGANRYTSVFESGNTLTTWVARSNPGVTFQTTSDEYDLYGSFAGMAYPSTGGVSTLSADGQVAGSALSESWILVWNTANQPRWSPFIVSFEKRPSSIHFSGGQVTIQFGQQAGYIGVTPLYGLAAPQSQATSWAAGLPASVVERARLLNQAAKAFPTNVSESWSVDRGNGDARVTYTYVFNTIQDAWGTQALQLSYLPPDVALAAWNGSPIRINNKTLEQHWDLDYPVPLGRVAGVKDAGSVTVSFPGLAKYWQNPPVDPLPPQSGDPLQSRLVAELGKMVSAGHLRSALGNPGHFNIRAREILGDYLVDYWHNPAETVITLLRALPLLPDGSRQQVTQYLQTEFQNYSPAQITHVGFRDGAPREANILPPEVESARQSYGPNDHEWWLFDGWQFPPVNLYAVSLYASRFGGASDLYNQVANRLETPKYPVSMPYLLDSYLAGYIGYLRLAELAGLGVQSTAEQELFQLFILRLALSKSPQSLAASGFEHGGYAWTVNSYQPDNGEIVFGPVSLGGFIGGYYFTIDFLNLVPETAAFLQDYALADVRNAVASYEQRAPYWFVANAEESTGEGVLRPLQERWGLFQAKALVLGESRQQLEPYLDVPAVAVGDLYYLQNLIAALETGGLEQ